MAASGSPRAGASQRAQDLFDKGLAERRQLAARFHLRDHLADRRHRALAAARGQETVLVVEDDPLVQGYVIAQLGSLGYRTLTAGDGASALALVDQGASFDLLFTDIIMPGGMSGRELAEAVRLRRPGSRCSIPPATPTMPSSTKGSSIPAWRCWGSPTGNRSCRRRLARCLRANRPSERPPTKKARRGGPVAPDFLLAGPGLRAPRCQASIQGSAGDPSEVTALGIRHWITSFRWLRKSSI